jgi:hypothetical protein
VYIEASPDRTSLCTCYGEVVLRDARGQHRRTIVSGYHTPAMIYADTVEGSMMGGAVAMNHTDQELIMLEALVGRVSPVKDRAKLRAPEEDVIYSPRPAPAQAAPQSPATAAQTTPPAPPSAAQAAPPAVPAPASQSSAPTTRSEVLDWRLPAPKDLPRR